MDSVVLPNTKFQVKIKSEVTPKPSSKDLENFKLKFKGDKIFFPKTDLTQSLDCSSDPCILKYKGKIVSPNIEGLFEDMSWNINYDGKILAQIINQTLETSCSDGKFCNGIERLVAGECMKSSVKPCQGDDDCTSYKCLEDTMSCSIKPIGKDCLTCQPKDCTPKCGKKTCGDDGCGGVCGVCPDGESCVGGKSCGVITETGSCVNPEPLFGDTNIVPAEGYLGYVYGDNSHGADLVQPDCNSPGIPEYVYEFVVEGTQNMGFQVSMTGEDGSNEYDSVLAIMGPNCGPISLTAADLTCSDDQTPPGNLASRIDGIVPPGRYSIVATCYSTKSCGPFRLQVKFTKNCRPKCDGKYCGDDDCGGVCGECEDGQICNVDSRCQSDPCIPDCTNRTCSYDGCGGQCGQCKFDYQCELRLGECKDVTFCDSYKPVCPEMSEKKQKDKKVYCASDCQWHSIDEPLPDLYANTEDQVIPSIYFLWQSFSSTSCAYGEGCVRGTGDRLLMRFDTRVHNIGAAQLKAPPVTENPQLFEWATCHQHYHYKSFARFALYDIDMKKIIVPGAKLSYCMEDAEQYLEGSDIPCEPKFTCDKQGIPRGRTDNYPASLDCQWLDITEVKPNCWYMYEVCTNWGRQIVELTFDNNCQSFPVYVPEITDHLQVVNYEEAIQMADAESFYPGCKA